MFLRRSDEKNGVNQFCSRSPARRILPLGAGAVRWRPGEARAPEARQPAQQPLPAPPPRASREPPGLAQSPQAFRESLLALAMDYERLYARRVPAAGGPVDAEPRPAGAPGAAADEALAEGAPATALG